MPRGHPRVLAGLVCVLVVGVTGCGSDAENEGDDRAAGSDAQSESAEEADEASTPEADSAERQDLCAALDDAPLNEIAAALGEPTQMDDYTEQASTDSTPPAVDQCKLPYTGRPIEPPEPDEDEEIIIEGEGTSGDGDIRLSLTVAAMSRDDFDLMRDRAEETAQSVYATVNDISGVGDAAYYSDIEVRVFVGDRILGIDYSPSSEAEFVEP